jgi:HEAT repeat protein
MPSMNTPKVSVSKKARLTIALSCGAIVGALLLLAVLVPTVRKPLARSIGLSMSEALRCQPDPDMQAVYRIRMHTQLKANAAALLIGARAGGKLITSDAGFSARLRMHVVEPRPDGTLVGLALDELEADDGEDETSKDMRAQLTTPFYAVLTRDCRFSEFGFDSSVSDEVVNRAQSLMQGLSLAVDPDATKLDWTSREYDSVGQYAAHYERPDAQSHKLVKQRQTYLRTHPSSGFATKEPLLVRVLDSNGPATLDDAFGWLAHFESHDHLQIVRANGIAVAELKMSLWLERSSEKAPAVALVNRVSDLHWRKQSEPPLVATPSRPDPPDAMKSLPLEAAMAQYAQLMRSGVNGAAVQAAEYLALYLRARPEMAAELMRLLAERQIPADLQSAIFLALERAGTPEAHDALIAGLSEEHEAQNRARAAAALPDVPMPSDKTLQALLETSQNAVSDNKDNTQLVRNAAGYAIGTLEQRTRVSNPALAGAALEELRGSLSNARGDQAQAAALDAISNSGNAALLKDIKPLLDSPEGLVRAHAIESMAHMDPQANKHMFGELIANEPDAKIRGTIAVTYAEQAKIANQPAPSEVLDAAIAQLGRESDPHVKGLLIELIGPAANTQAYAQQALGAQFKRETDPMLLKLIGKWVPGNRLGM